MARTIQQKLETVVSDSRVREAMLGRHREPAPADVVESFGPPDQCGFERAGFYKR
jgi:hypothetical protein